MVPTGIDIIGEDAFYNNNFKTLVIPEGVKCIEHNAFYCSSSVKISLPSSLCYISEDAFAGIQFVDSYGGLVITVPHGLKEKYKKLFSEVIPEDLIDPTLFKYIDYCYYNCCEADDYYVKKDSFEEEI